MIFQEISWIRSNLEKFCPTLRRQALEWYRPFRFVPCFLQKYFKGVRQHFHKIPVIVQMQPSEEFVSCLSTLENISGCKINHKLHLVNAFSTKVNAKTLEKLIKHDSVCKVWYDAEVKAVLDVARPTTKASAPALSNVTGKGVTVAIVDTGIYPHKDLTGRIKAFKDFVGNKTSPYDDDGHGTHVAGDVAGNGASSNGKYKGIAPDAELVGVKVLDRTGSGALSTVMAGVQWCIDNKSQYNINVINMSLGSSATVPASEDPMVTIVEKAWAAGIVVCVAAGNEGPDGNTISSPGDSPKVITVGAMDDMNTADRGDDAVAGFSSRGPTIDGLIKPDVLSPGVNIISLRSPNSYLDRANKSARVDTNYFSMSGTSMATPICAGVVALMLQVRPTLTPDQAKQILMNTAEDRGLPGNVQGSGYIDAEKAVLS